MPNKFAHHRKTISSRFILNFRADVPNAAAFMGGADYLGPELNGETYRLKFMENGRVIWVDVDAQTGRIIRRSRP